MFSYQPLQCLSKWYYDQKITFLFPSDFETMFTKHHSSEILSLNFEKKTVHSNCNFPFYWSAIITPERIHWRHSLESCRMQCVSIAYKWCKTRVWESEKSKLPCCILNKALSHPLHSKALEWMTSLNPFWCNNGGLLTLFCLGFFGVSEPEGGRKAPPPHRSRKVFTLLWWNLARL